jgi:hypothetical protein
MNTPDTKTFSPPASAEPGDSKFILYTTDDGRSRIALYADGGSVWLNQSQLAELFDTSKQLISHHANNILKEGELFRNSVVKEYLTTGSDGKSYSVLFYALPMILAIGFRVRSVRGTQFRIWANQHLAEYLVKGFVIDDERLKNPDGRPDYFDELLARIRDIRASEKRFYQKLRDLFALSSDYQAAERATQMFFAETQNKLLFAVTGKTAAELVLARADADKPNMGLTSWKGRIVRKGDIVVAKNYLTQDELDMLNRLVSIFLDVAEIQVKRRTDLTLPFWRGNVDRLIQAQDLALLTGGGSVSNQAMEDSVRQTYETFDARRKAADARAADEADLKALEESIQHRKKETRR